MVYIVRNKYDAFKFVVVWAGGWVGGLQAWHKRQRAKELLGRTSLPATRGIDAGGGGGGELGVVAFTGGPVQQAYVLTRAGPDHPAVSSEPPGRGREY